MAPNSIKLLAPGPEWRDIEAKLDGNGVPIALESRLDWVQLIRKGRGRLAVACDGDQVTLALGLLVFPSRALPKHEIWRIERLGLGLPNKDLSAILRETGAELKRLRSVLRLEATLISPDPERRMLVGRALTEAGFRRLPHCRRIYEHTLILDLTPTSESLFAALSSNTRRNIRLPEKRGYEVRTVEDPDLAPRLQELLDEVFQRTGGRAEQVDWRAVITLSKRQPDRSRLVALFRPGASRPNDLLAFAWGQHNGEYANYCHGASTRRSEVNMPFGYALIWDLVLWSKTNQARWFDFGGVTDMSADNPLGGISELKRRFSTTEVAAGQEWTFEPHPSRARLANWISTARAMLPS